MQRKQGSEERGPQLSDSLQKGSRAHEMSNQRMRGEENRLQTVSATLACKSAATEKKLDRGSMGKNSQATILAHLRPRLTNGNLCVRAGGIAGERAGLDTDRHSAAVQPALPALHAYSETV